MVRLALPLVGSPGVPMRPGTSNRLTPTPNLSLSELEVFVTALRARSLREASRQLDLLPTHLSKIIRNLLFGSNSDTKVL